LQQFWAAIVVCLFFYTWTDILIWQRIFETHELWEIGIGAYHRGWQMALYGMLLLGFVIFLPDLRKGMLFALCLYCLAHSGLEDVLYYWLDGRAIPARLPWLDEAPLILFSAVTHLKLLLSALLWVALWVMFTIKLFLRPHIPWVRARPMPAGATG